SKRAVNVNAKDTAKSVLQVLHEDDGILFCSICNVSIDHTCKSTIDNHLKSKSHLKCKHEMDSEQSNVKVLKQTTVSSGFDNAGMAKQSRVEVITDWIKAYTAADVPLEKSDSPALREFFHKHAKNGGAIPQSSQLRESYFSDVYENERTLVKQILAGKKLAIIADETSGVENRSVLNILATPLETNADGKITSYLLTTTFMDKVNHSTVAQSIVQTLMAYEISFMDVFIFHSDNAAYMKKCFTDVLAGLMPNCTHMTCYSHILDLVAHSITQHFSAALKYMKYMNNLFAIPSGRKARFLQYISTVKSRDPNVPLKLPPEPVETRWNTYFEAARYHASNMKYHKAFIDSENELLSHAPTKYLLLLKEILHDDNQMRKGQIQMSFLADKSEMLSKLLDNFQSHKPTALNAHDKVEELQ
uniref:DUF659 domain-containing protein n=1 Tax=Latimeria chalumnae TaxID=7897 RepID=H2ZVW5_LATCH